MEAIKEVVVDEKLKNFNEQVGRKLQESQAFLDGLEDASDCIGDF